MGGWWFVCDVELCCLCLVLLLRFVWVYEWCISSQVCIVAVLCVQLMNPVCVVCVVTSDWGLFLVCLFVTEVTNPNDWSLFVCVCRRVRI